MSTMPDAVLTALRKYRDFEGRYWKAKLCRAWERGDDLGWELQWARNSLGPSGLYRLKLREVGDDD